MRVFHTKNGYKHLNFWKMQSTSFPWHLAKENRNLIPLHMTQSYSYLKMCSKSCTFFIYLFGKHWAPLVAQTVENLPAVQETWVQSLGQENPLEKAVVTHVSILVWRIPWTEEPGGLQSTGSQRLRHDRVTYTWQTLLSSIYQIDSSLNIIFSPVGSNCHPESQFLLCTSYNCHQSTNWFFSAITPTRP